MDDTASKLTYLSDGVGKVIYRMVRILTSTKTNQSLTFSLTIQNQEVAVDIVYTAFSKKGSLIYRASKTDLSLQLVQNGESPFDSNSVFWKPHVDTQ
ncbi:hypothetical protein F2Q69_00060031 [Brassica cretica]|uniref:Uncharacterized protein n=1 Tax=Brassica cretica TaxID=69181 RepID=A0A8S9RMP9_BRACR|nr:hypothetical protein F2Q69_00060031 [Brassica cretica]